MLFFIFKNSCLISLTNFQLRLKLKHFFCCSMSMKVQSRCDISFFILSTIKILQVWLLNSILVMPLIRVACSSFKFFHQILWCQCVFLICLRNDKFTLLIINKIAILSVELEAECQIHQQGLNIQNLSLAGFFLEYLYVMLGIALITFQDC